MFHVLEVPKFGDHRKWCCDLFICILFCLLKFSSCLLMHNWDHKTTKRGFNGSPYCLNSSFLVLQENNWRDSLQYKTKLWRVFSTFFFSSELIIKFENLGWGWTLRFLLISDLILASSKRKEKI